MISNIFLLFCFDEKRGNEIVSSNSITRDQHEIVKNETLSNQDHEFRIMLEFQMNFTTEPMSSQASELKFHE